jgi:hypothetical protein
MNTDPNPLAAWMTEHLPHIPPEERQRLARDFECYRRELPRLLREGHANRFALIKDGQVVSVWDTYGDARQAGYERFSDEPFSVNRLNPLDPDRFALLDAKLQAQREAGCPS